MRPKIGKCLEPPKRPDKGSDCRHFLVLPNRRENPGYTRCTAATHITYGAIAHSVELTSICLACKPATSIFDSDSIVGPLPWCREPGDDLNVALAGVPLASECSTI